MRGAAPTSVTCRRVERFDRAGSTNDIVRAWLADGEPEICVAVATEQTAGRGRLGRTWVAPAGAALLVSLGFRPDVAARRADLAAGSLGLAGDGGRGRGCRGLPVGSIRCKWPNDLVIETTGPHALLTGVTDVADAARRLAAPLELRKLAGVLGESDGLGTDDPRVVVGVGINADWAAADFPPELATAMTSLREASGGRPIDPTRCSTNSSNGWTGGSRRSGPGTSTWTRGPPARASPGAWSRSRAAGTPRQAAGDRARAGDGVRALGIDAGTGGLVVEDASAPSGERVIHAGDVVRVRLVPGRV